MRERRLFTASNVRWSRTRVTSRWHKRRSRRRVAPASSTDRAKETREGSGEQGRTFLASSRGMASAFLALNTVFGRLRDRSCRGDRVEAAAIEAEAVGPVCLRHPDPSRRRAAPVSVLLGCDGWAPVNPDLAKDRGTMDELYLAKLHQGDLFSTATHGRRDQRNPVGDRR